MEHFIELTVMVSNNAIVVIEYFQTKKKTTPLFLKKKIHKTKV